MFLDESLKRETTSFPFEESTCVIKPEVTTWIPTLTAEVALVDDTLTLIRQYLWLHRSIVGVTYLTDVVTISRSRPGTSTDSSESQVVSFYCLWTWLCFRVRGPIYDQDCQQLSPNMTYQIKEWALLYQTLLKCQWTRMHSSRMHTGRSLTVCCSLLPAGGESAWSGGGVCLIQGGLPCWGGLVWGGLPGPRGLPGPGGSAWSGGSAQGGFGGSAPRGVVVYPSMHWGRHSWHMLM